MANVTDYKQELIEKVRENYLSIGLGVLVFLVIMTLIFRAPQSPEAEKAPETKEMTKRTYVVQPGDSLSSIARDQLGSMDMTEELVKLNNISQPDAIEVGTKLTLPESQAKVEDTKGEVNGGGAMTGDTYTVAKGDHLWSIAQKVYGDGNMYTKILEANNLTNADQIEVGMVLKLPRAK